MADETSGPVRPETEPHERQTILASPCIPTSPKLSLWRRITMRPVPAEEPKKTFSNNDQLPPPHLFKVYSDDDDGCIEHHPKLHPAKNSDKRSSIFKSKLVNSISQTIERYLKEDAKKSWTSDSDQSLAKTASISLAQYLLPPNVEASKGQIHTLTFDLAKSQTSAYLTSRPRPSEPTPAVKHLVPLLENVIPSPSVASALRPVVLWLPTEHGPLRKPTARIVGQSLPLAQGVLDRQVKSSLFRFLENEESRAWVKGAMRGFIVKRSYGCDDDGCYSG